MPTVSLSLLLTLQPGEKTLCQSFPSRLLVQRNCEIIKFVV